ncbi:MAG TPA: toprim domain-containing protein, partial [Bacilli bacterium]|nr:toprim domain-containing protein [Bacilli bacterium]
VPIGVHESGKSTPEVIFTILHAGGKFSESGYKVSGGLHGVGASVVNALSRYMDVTIYRDGVISNIRFENGGKVSKPLKQIGPTNKTGTTVTFLPEETIFNNIAFSYSTICERMQECAFLLKQLTVEIVDDIENQSTTYHYENGLINFVEYINEDKKVLHPVINFNSLKSQINVEVAMQYTDTYNENIISFVNNVKTSDGGTHEVGFKTGLTKAFNEYARNNNIFKNKDGGFEGSDVREGLFAVISLQIPEALLQFEGQTKGKLGTNEARSIVENVVYDYLKYYLEENKEIALLIINKAARSKLAREAARKAREEARSGKDKKAIERNLSGKLVPAQTRNPQINELFLVEGDSALGSAKQARDRKYQAILPLRGKVVNAEKASQNDVFGSEELNTIIHTLGAGVGSDFNIKDTNYNKVIILTDADDDGAHIQVLLLTFFYRYMRPLIENGHLYVAMPPLFLVTTSDKKRTYFWTNEEVKEFTSGKSGYKLKRFKGLGEMNPDQLEETTMNPHKRNLIKVSISDAALAEKRVTVLMGDAVEPRKEWINANVEFSLEDNYPV